MTMFKRALMMGVVAACVAVPAMADPTDLANQQVIVKPKEAASVTFETTAERKIHVTVRGVADADKGFRVLFVDQDSLEACVKSPADCKSKAGLGSMGAVTALDQTGTVPAGKWAFAVVNSENMIYRLTAQVRVTAE